MIRKTGFLLSIHLLLLGSLLSFTSCTGDSAQESEETSLNNTIDTIPDGDPVAHQDGPRDTATLVIYDDSTDARPLAFETYGNTRFSYTIDYPDFLIPQEEADNGDGRVFLSADEKISLRVYGFNRLEPESIEKALEERVEELQGRTITYKVARDNFYVISGTFVDRDRGGETQIFYEKSILQKQVGRTMEMLYPIGMKSVIDPVVEQVSQSFRDHVIAPAG